MAPSTDSQQQQAPQAPGGPGEAIMTEPASHNPHAAAVSSGVELDDLESAGDPNDISRPSQTLAVGSISSPAKQPSASLQNGDRTASVEPSTPRLPDSPTAAKHVASTASPPATPTVASATHNQPPTKEPKPSSPTIQITLLLLSGARHPYRVDDKYLRKRGVSFMDNDPFTISIYTLKELIWKDWREEWEPRPTSPSSIRLIHFGRLLEDKAQLKDAPNVLHMNVKPQEVVDDEDAAKAKHGLGGSRDGSERSSSCRCVIL
ncbi:hypothetical protein GP486_003160 [Trichoglossum hirsutum]|uniref:UBL3-like ubiquitin domain-containing protein n=1 Tax=Trichoglossum hirsutum TaxID=265104 RepID=A0A9P8LDL1_9PEZI|nr:hypothetical protein GP486_003160 [Trichoglossum hirsutum]